MKGDFQSRRSEDAKRFFDDKLFHYSRMAQLETFTTNSFIATVSISISIGILIALKFIKTDRQIPQNDDYMISIQHPSTTTEVDLFVPSPLNPKYLKQIKIKYSNKSFAATLRIDDIDNFILHILSNHQSLQPMASYYSGSTPQKRGICAYVGTMGDGRVVSIGQIKDKFGKFWEVQLKGFGKTTLCEKHKDGKMSLSEYEKEFKCWSKLKEFGIPTYQILAAVGLNGSARRKKQSKSAMFGLVRCSNTWLRVGHFEYLYYSNQSNKHTMLWIINRMNQIFEADNEQRLNDEKYLNAISEHDCSQRLQDWMKQRVILRRDEIEINDEINGENDEKILFFLKNVFGRNALMIASWMFYGFVHGMMRSDNIHIGGISFDLGSGVFMDMEDENAFDPSFQIGKVAMYSYENQVECHAITMKRLAVCCTSLINDADLVQAELYRFWIYVWYFLMGLLRKEYGENAMDLMYFEREMNPNKFKKGHRWLIEKFKLQT